MPWGGLPKAEAPNQVWNQWRGWMSRERLPFSTVFPSSHTYYVLKINRIKEKKKTYLLSFTIEEKQYFGGKQTQGKVNNI